MMRAMTAALALAALAAAPALGAEEPGAYELRTYVVRSLVDPVRDFQAVRYSLDPAGGVREGLDHPSLMGMRDIEERPRLLGSEELLEVLEQSVAFFREGGDARSLLRITNGVLYVAAPPGAVRELEKVIEALEKEASRSVALRALVFRWDGEAARALGAVRTPSHVLDAGRAGALLSLLDGPGGRVLEQASTSALSGQRVYLSHGREREFLRGLEAQAAEKAGLVSPVVDVLRDGLVLELRPALSPTGRSVEITYAVNCSRYREIRFDTRNPALGVIDVPRLRYFRAGGTAVVPLGGGVLFGPLPRDLDPAAREAKDDGGAEGEAKGGSGKGGAAPPAEGDVHLLLHASSAPTEGQGGG